ncbi:MAG TPA: lysophospholipid acyltransferase family protein [Solirubrobacteraceae bacterium]
MRRRQSGSARLKRRAQDLLIAASGVFLVRRRATHRARLKRRTRKLLAAAPSVLLFRRRKSTSARLGRRARDLLPAAPQLDVKWARSGPAIVTREMVLTFLLAPILAFYTRRRITGANKLARLRAPVILVANHVSHIDTPVILAALPRRLRRRTVVAAAADYFYRNRVVAVLVSLIFNTVPMARGGGGLGKQAAAHVDGLLDRGWNLLLYPEGTRSRSGGPGRLRRGAAVLAARHDVSIVPIRVTGTRDAMPPGSFWPSRIRSRIGSRRHPVSISFGDPIAPTDDLSAVIESVQGFFEGDDQISSPAAADQPSLPAAGA